MNDGASDRPSGATTTDTDAAARDRHRTSTFDLPVRGAVERVAARAADRVRSQYWSPVVVAIGGLLAMAVVLIAVGEVVTHLGALSWLRDADDRVSQSLADHRTSGWNGFS